MRVIIVAVCVVLASAHLRPEELGNPMCQKYACGSWPNNGTCIVSDSQTTTVQPCQPPNTCNVDTGLCESPSPPSPQPGWPGEPCSQINPCAHGSCSSGVCVGAQAGASCSMHDDCDPGLMCSNSNICTPLLQIGSTGCVSHFDCQYNSFCNRTYTSATGTCVQTGKVPLGGFVTDCNNTFSWMCGTNTCVLVDMDLMLGYCSPALLSTGPVPTGCSDDTGCIATDGTNFFQGTCTCGINLVGNSFCAANYGDVPGVTYRMTMNLAYTRSQRCNTVRRFTNACFNATGTLGRVKSALFGFFHYPLVQQNPNCVRAVYTSDYWSSAGVTLQAAALAFALIVG